MTTQTVVCSRCGATKEPLGSAPLPGPLGDAVARHICGDCWAEWMETSLRVINHYGLHPSSKEHRDKLFEFMRDFLKLPPE